MSPEYKIYVPKEIAEDFKKAVLLIPDTEIISERPVKRDRDSKEKNNNLYEDLANSAREVLHQLPVNTRISDLYSWNYPQRFKSEHGIQTQEQWSDFMTSLGPGERTLITRCLSTLRKNNPKDIELQNIKKLTLEETMYYRGVGKVTLNLIYEIFLNKSNPVNLEAK